MFIAVALPLLLYSVLGSLKVAASCKFDHFHIFKSFTFLHVLNLGEEEKVTWGDVLGLWGLMYLWNVVFG
jgi:hypothetical protein